MIGFLIIAHKPFGSGLIEAARHILGDIPDIAVLDVLPHATTGLALARAEQLIAEVDTGYGVLIMADLFGATPANIAAQLADAHVKVVAGVNLSMLLRAISYRTEPLADVAEKATAGGLQGIVNVGSKAPQKQAVVPDSSNRDQRAFVQHQQ